MPPSVIPPSMSKPTKRMDFASFGSITDGSGSSGGSSLRRSAPSLGIPLFGSSGDSVPDVDGARHQIVERVEGDHVRAVARRVVGIGVGFHEQPIGTGGRRGQRERRYELARATTGAARALPRTLHAMRRVEDHGHVAGLAHSAKAAHVDDQITVAEECPALGDGDFVRRSAFAIELRVTATALHFFHGAAHPFRVHPLPLLHVHRAARGAGGEEEAVSYTHLTLPTSDLV